MDGILVVNKEKGKTSRDVVNDICHVFNTKKVGHTGTLDPLATGVLVLGINNGLKIINELNALDKEYEAEVLLGTKTDTLDIEGKILEEKLVEGINNDDIDKVLNSFLGKYEMEVPLYSAVKINGKKLYEYARNNEKIDLPIHNVTIYDIKRTSDIIYIDGKAKFTFKCKVSKGTYIRSLIRDISKKLNTIGIMSNLNRIKQGDFDIKDSYSINDIKNGKYRLLNISDCIKLPKIEIEDSIYKKVINGNKLSNIYNYKRFCFVKDNTLVAIYKIDENNNSLIKPERVFKI